eukprot:GHVL01032056.1.p1 GENE.GHVL01032056.1~~GHVL01032056.1.p1  ORF type:complete len:145 (+),score=39.94 GHVL01032056.1:99-533(+)
MENDEEMEDTGSPIAVNPNDAILAKLNEKQAKIRKQRPRLTGEILVGEGGFPKLLQISSELSKKIKPGKELKDFDDFMSKCQFWANELFPAIPHLTEFAQNTQKLSVTGPPNKRSFKSSAGAGGDNDGLSAMDEAAAQAEKYKY